MFLIAVQIQELLVDGVAFGMFHRPLHYALHPLGHCRIKHQVAGEHGHAVPLYDVLHLEEGIPAPQTQCLGLGGQGHYVAVVARQYAHGLALESRMQGALNGGEEGVAVGEGNHS